MIIDLKPNDIHLLPFFLPNYYAQEKSLLALLNAEEQERAKRFHQAIHTTRFILARGLLRQVLAKYLDTDPQLIRFAYGKRQKPYLADNDADLQFNISHSDDMAVIALRKTHQIGVDIEKIQSTYEDGIAKRFFSPDEYAELHALPESQRLSAFYRGWARKEALIKTLGEGLYAPLHEFTVSLTQTIETIPMRYQDRDYRLHLESFSAHGEYQSAFATDGVVEKVIYQSEFVAV